MKIHGILKGRAVTIPNKKDEARLLSKHYGKRDKLGLFKLNLVEAEYLQDKNRLSVVDLAGKIVDLTKIIINSKTLKIERAVYAKLRLDGYVVDFDKTRVANMTRNTTNFSRLQKIWVCYKKKEKYLVRILDENSALKWQNLFKLTDLAAKNKIKLILAIVDKDEDVTLESVQFTNLK
ncbi:MAG: hypothetical protein COW47_00065 [Candidatus Huberarchaeum crystalense]|uniref:tRNA intron endonuclease catalytic domain-containing protein n=1 Tax=Huberarchaeum crystalense TaxID=2014257 RepID=A0A2G9LJE2_HUBC1|nr:hypothetical protein [archaeon]OIP20243.1 MAG: hypothetical protein AUJ91_01805 [archaeon CG2_30_31_98]PIN66657.1 MAG: hypothetical protein COW69_01055 [Candidatus Huberarchaeum crystalense]NCS98267.1 hypothetical protein [archaeon]PIV13749.1 MAG: hypothetical protein COS45_01280 [Candidatus Huberarchaeum crystalense]